MDEDLHLTGNDWIKKLVGPDEDSRPGFLQKCPKVLEYGRFMGVLLLAIVLLTEGRSGPNPYDDSVPATIVVVAGVLALAFALIDIITYRPLLLVFFGSGATRSGKALARLASDSDGLKHELEALTTAPPENWADVVKVHNTLVYVMSTNLVIPARARQRMVVRLAAATASVVFSLGSIAYGLNAVSDGMTLNVASASAGAPNDLPGAAEVLSFTAANFFTMGTGAISVAPSGSGYLFLILNLVSLFVVLYFVISFALGSYLHVEKTLSSAVHEFVLSLSPMV